MSLCILIETSLCTLRMSVAVPGSHSSLFVCMRRVDKWAEFGGVQCTRCIGQLVDACLCSSTTSPAHEQKKTLNSRAASSKHLGQKAGTACTDFRATHLDTRILALKKQSWLASTEKKSPKNPLGSYHVP